MKRPIIQFDNFSFKYRTQMDVTLKQINLTIYEGEKILILGPSGSGKSTLSQCINGLIPNSYSGDITGTLLVCNKEPAKVGIFEMSKSVGTVLQDPDGQFIGLTVAEDIAFSMENECVAQPIMKQKVQEAATLVSIDHLLEQPPQELSGGQKQRVSIAGVMTEQVEILLFDEPLANLDPAAGKYTIELIDQIHQLSNTTVIIIEHRLEDVLYRQVDRIIVMDNGEIVADMNPDMLLSGNILTTVGIREPLYITALKYANCKIQENQKPSQLNTYITEIEKSNIQNWYNSYTKEKTQAKEEEILKIEKIHFSYANKRPVLQDVQFTIKKGEMISIVGKNGAGKSTLAKLICGFEQVNEGRILFRGKDMANDGIAKRAEKIGYVMQNPNQMISKSLIFEEVALGLIARGLSEEETKQRVEATLKICGLYPFRNWPVSALSFGQKKRVTIASILILNPEIIILDEPTAGQDFRHYTEIMKFLEELNRNHGITILMITHDMHLMLEYTTRGIVIADGKLIFDQKTSEILTNSNIVEQASLKVTSLFELAKDCEIENPIDFIESFIEYDREVREHGADAILHA